MSMWIVFCDTLDRVIHNDIDRNVVAIVRDEDLLGYQSALAGSIGDKYELIPNLKFAQEFVSVHGKRYYTRKYEVWSSFQ